MARLGLLAVRLLVVLMLLGGTSPIDAESSATAAPGVTPRSAEEPEYRAAVEDDIIPGRIARSSRGWYDYGNVPEEQRTIGRIEIPRVGVNAPIRVGVDDDTLRRGVGFFPDSALPSQPGNTALAAHRGTDFWGLRKIRIGDRVTVRTEQGTFEYAVEGTRVVDPSEVWVVDPTEHKALTLITCYPFDYRGTAPQRFVVRARPVA